MPAVLTVTASPSVGVVVLSTGAPVGGALLISGAGADRVAQLPGSGPGTRQYTIRSTLRTVSVPSSPTVSVIVTLPSPLKVSV